VGTKGAGGIVGRSALGTVQQMAGNDGRGRNETLGENPNGHLRKEGVWGTHLQRQDRIKETK